MWGAVLVMALAAMVDPLRIGLTVLVISRPRPMFQLFAFWIGGLVMGLTVGLGVLFLLREPALAFMHDMASTTGATSGFISIALGVLALLIATLIAVRRGRLTPAPQLGTATAFSRLSTRAADALRGESLWVSLVAGAWLATPLQYVAALAAVLASGADARTQVGAVVLYQVVVLAFAEIPLISQLFAPATTRAVMTAVHDWVAARRRELIAVLVAAVGVFLVINGIGSV